MSAWRPGQWKIIPVKKRESTILQDCLIERLNKIQAKYKCLTIEEVLKPYIGKQVKLTIEVIE